MQQHYPQQKNYRMSKKKKKSSLNAVLRTAQELYTYHYVGVDVLPCDSLQQKSYYKHHCSRDAQHYLCADMLYDYSTD
jgi:hypothetical protein